jgi:hypothetical protein
MRTSFPRDVRTCARENSPQKEGSFLSVANKPIENLESGHIIN